MGLNATPQTMPLVNVVRESPGVALAIGALGSWRHWPHSTSRHRPRRRPGLAFMPALAWTWL